MSRTELETDGGRYIDLTAPRPEDVTLSDVAGALSKTCRFAGHVRRFYSVAEHAVLVSGIVESVRPDLAFPALHHDSHEAYLGDVPTPLKRALGAELVAFADRLDTAIAARWGVNPEDFDHPVVKWADTLAMRIEARELKWSQGAGPHWGYDTPAGGLENVYLGRRPERAEQEFRDRHLALAGVPA